MNIKSLLLLVGLVTIITPAAFADHPQVTISIMPTSDHDGCTHDAPCYDPMHVTIESGSEIIWNNDGSITTSVMSGILNDADAGSIFKSSALEPGTTYTFMFEEAGTYNYFSPIQPWMTGVIVVEEIADHHDEADHGMDVGDDMDAEMMMPADAPTATGMLSDGTIVEIYATEPTADARMDIDVVFQDAEHVNYDLVVTQNGQNVLDDAGAHAMKTKGATHTTRTLDSSDPVTITLRFAGYGMSLPYSGPAGDELTVTITHDGMVHGMMDGVDVMMMPADAPTATGMLSDGTVIEIYATEPTENARMDIDVVFQDAEHVNYDLVVTQNGQNVLDDAGAHAMKTKGATHTTRTLDSSDPVTITLRFAGYGMSLPYSGPAGEEVTFTNIVPEFGPVAVTIILGAAIAGIIVAGKKTALVPRL